MGTDPEKTIILKDRCTPTFMAALCTRANTRMKPKWVRRDGWVNKAGYSQTEQLQLSHKKGDISPGPATSKEVEMITLSKVRQRKTSII